MSCDRLTHLDDATLLRSLSALVARDRATTAEILAHIAEVDRRRLYLEAAYSSMFAYCVGELRFSEDAAYKRIQAARAARRFPRLFEEVAAGRLHLTALGLLAPHLDESNVDELVAAAAGRTKTALESWIAERFQGPVAPALRARVIAIKPVVVHAAAVRASAAVGQLAQVGGTPPSPEPAPAQLADPVPPPRYVLQIPITEATHAKVRRAQALLAHAVPSGDLAGVIDRALDLLIARLEKQKGAAPVAPRRAREINVPRGRTIPAEVRRAVWARDGGRCTFTSPAGRGCDATRRLEFDHAVAFARGGVSTVEGLRLRCRAHNQLEAERTFGAEFMRRKRAEAERPEGQVPDPEVESALRGIGCRTSEARRAAIHAATLGAARIEDRLHGAQQFLGASRISPMAGGRPAGPG